MTIAWNPYSRCMVRMERQSGRLLTSWLNNSSVFNTWSFYSLCLVVLSPPFCKVWMGFCCGLYSSSIVWWSPEDSAVVISKHFLLKFCLSLRLHWSNSSSVSRWFGPWLFFISCFLPHSSVPRDHEGIWHNSFLAQCIWNHFNIAYFTRFDVD